MTAKQVKVLRQVKQLAGRGLGVVLSTHDPDHALAVASRVLLLHDGGLVADGLPPDVLTPEHLKVVYGVKVAIETLSQGGTVCAPEYGG